MNNSIEISTLKAMSSIVSSNDGKVFLEYLKSIHRSLFDVITIAKDEVTLRWLQGRTQQLSELISTIETAEDTIRALKR